jgi:hypothetical protein
MATVQLNYPAGTATITISPHNVATSGTFVGGVESDAISNISNLDLDHLVSGTWTTGTTPTINTQVQVWVIPVLADDLAGTHTWPSVFDGTASAESVPTAGMLQSVGRLIGTIVVDATTSDLTYAMNKVSVAALFGGSLPSQYVLFITHNTGVNSNSTAGNFVWTYQRVRQTVA